MRFKEPPEIYREFFSEELRCLVFQAPRKGWFSVQILEHDIVIHTNKDIMTSVEDTLYNYFELCRKRDIYPFSGIPSAPRKFYERYTKGTKFGRISRLPFDVHLRFYNEQYGAIQ